MSADVMTLSDDAAQLAAYQERKALRSLKKVEVGQEQFLSNLQEIDSDVAYRFKFTVVGSIAQQVVDAVVRSDAAVSLGGGLSPKPPSKSLRCHHPCLCYVSPGAGQQNGAKQVAKLALQVCDFEEEVPACETRQEALSAAIVYALTIDTSKGDQFDSDFKEQLDAFERALSRLRMSTKAKVRPVKVVLLCLASDDGMKATSSLERWAVQLADFEQEHGDMWKFGPIALECSDGLHGAFAEMASARIAHLQSGKDGDLQRGVDAVDPAEQDDDTVKEAWRLPASGARHRPVPSSTGSQFSEQEKPPQFAAEMSGSECSDTAKEHHKRVFDDICERQLPETQVAGKEYAMQSPKEHPNLDGKQCECCIS